MIWLPSTRTVPPPAAGWEVMVTVGLMVPPPVTRVAALKFWAW